MLTHVTELSRPSISSLLHVHTLNDALNRFGNAPSCSPGEQDSRDLQAPTGGTATCFPPALSTGQRRKPHIGTERAKVQIRLFMGFYGAGSQG